MNRKGFTLMELLAVVVILGLLAALLTPTVKRLISDSEETVSKQQIDTIVTATKKYMVEHSELLPDESDSSNTVVFISELISKGVIDNEKTINDLKDNCVIVSYNSSYNQYEYNYSSNCE